MKDKVCSKSKVMNTAKHRRLKLARKPRQPRPPMYEWNTLPWHQLDRKVFKLQKRIYQASERGDVRVARRLQKLLISSWSAKAVAVRKVTQDNQGKKRMRPRVDTKALAPCRRKTKALAPCTRTKQTVVVDGDKSLSPRKRMEMVKNIQLGRTEKRPLGIPSMNERAKQALVKMAIEPEWEAKFEPNSYGFRPGRSCHDAIGAIYIALGQKTKYVLDADISKCFDKIDHQKLLEKLDTNPTFKRQIKAWLKAGVMDQGELFPTKEGTPQGGVVSTLLANVALHGLEDLIKKTFPARNGYRQRTCPHVGKWWGRATPDVIRYADDFLVLHSDIEVIKQCKHLIETWLKDIGLELKPEKTRISHTLEEYEGNTGFDFLGFHVQHHKVGKYKSGFDSKKRHLGFKLRITPSKKSIRNHLIKIEEVIDKHRASKTDKVIGILNPIIRGWSNYFRGVISSKTFKLLDHLTYQKLRRWANRRHPNKGKKWVKNKYWKSIDNQNWVFSDTYGDEITCTLINHSDTKIIRHVKVRGIKSPDDGDFVYWSQRLSTYPETSTRVKTLLKKQKGICTICRLSFTSQDILEVDHIKPRSQGGNDTYKNLQLLHRHYHDNKSRQDYVEWHKQKYSRQESSH